VGDYQDKENFAAQQRQNPRHNKLLPHEHLQNASKCAFAHCYKGLRGVKKLAAKAGNFEAFGDF
jgi:hypothetical protein